MSSDNLLEVILKNSKLILLGFSFIIFLVIHRLNFFRIWSGKTFAQRVGLQWLKLNLGWKWHEGFITTLKDSKFAIIIVCMRVKVGITH